MIRHLSVKPGLMALLPCLWLFPMLSWGQIILSQDHFPNVGDTLHTSIDALPSSISITAPGPNQHWDFTTLQGPFVRHTLVLPVTAGEGFESFPNATQLHPLDDGLEAYYRVESGQYQLLGFYGEDPLEFGLAAPLKLDRPLPERRTPLRFNDAHQNETSLSLTIAVDDLPQEALDELPFAPDSLRIRGNLAREEEVDAWGDLLIPGGIFEVLRIRQVEVRELKLDAKINPLPWTEITEIVPENDFLGEVRTVKHIYYSNDAVEAIAEVFLDDTETRAQQVIFKASEYATAVKRLSSRKSDIYAYPNPAIADVRFAFSDLPAGNYTLRIFNILGIEKWKENYYIDGDITEKVNIASLSKGSYLYSLSNAEGKTLVTKRLIIIKP